MDIAMSEQAYETDAGQTHDPLFAEAVRKAAAQLNQCIARAHAHGLYVEIEQIEVRAIEDRYGQAKINVHIERRIKV